MTLSDNIVVIYLVFILSSINLCIGNQCFYYAYFDIKLH